MNLDRYVVREVCNDESLNICPRETLFFTLGEADKYAFRRARVLNGIWRVSVCCFRLKEVSTMVSTIR